MLATQGTPLWLLQDCRVDVARPNIGRRVSEPLGRESILAHFSWSVAGYAGTKLLILAREVQKASSANGRGALELRAVVVCRKDPSDYDQAIRERSAPKRT